MANIPGRRPIFSPIDCERFAAAIVDTDARRRSSAPAQYRRRELSRQSRSPKLTDLTTTQAISKREIEPSTESRLDRTPKE